MVIFIVIVDERGQILNVNWCSPDNLLSSDQSLYDLMPLESREGITSMLASSRGESISSTITQLIFEGRVIPITIYSLTISEKIVVIGFDNVASQSKVYDEFICIYNDFANKVRDEFNSAIKVRETSIKKQFEEIQKLNNELINTKRNLEKNNFQITKYNLELRELYEQLDREINKAKTIHENNLPIELPKVEGIYITPYYQPACVMGGDYYDAIQVGDKLIFYVSDVSGHNLDGAIMSVFVKITINNYLALAGYEQITPAKIVSYVFEQYNKENYPADYFICLQIHVLDLKSYQLTYASSGFNYPGFCCIEGKIISLLNCGLPISCAYPIELLNLHEHSISLTSSSTILILTDGIIEAEKNGQQYGINRVKKVFLENHSLPTDVIRNKINADYHDFTGSIKGQDDITYLLIQACKNPSCN